MQAAERLTSLHGYVTFLAHKYAFGNRAFQDDLYQDAMEAMWKELLKAEEKGRSLNDSFLTHKARWVMIDRVRKGRWESPVEPDEDDGWPLDKPVLDDPDMLAHRPEIRAAIAGLTPRQREYIYLRFWKDYRKPDMKQTGISQANWYGSGGSAGAKAILASKLAHLADAA